MDGPFDTITDFAARLKVHRHTVERMIKRGLPTLRLQTAIRIPVQEALAWLSSRPKPTREYSPPVRKVETPSIKKRVPWADRVPVRMSREG